jgi:hypothetical protein
MSRLSESQPGPELVSLRNEDLSSIIARFNQRLAELTVGERNERHLIEDAEENTASWYDRGVHARTGHALEPSMRQHIINLLENKANGLVAKLNADQLINDLSLLEGAIGTSGLKLQEERRLRSEIEGLRRDLLKAGHYHRTHDEAMVRMAALVKTAQGGWADNHLNVLESYLGRDRWWL